MWKKCARSDREYAYAGAVIQIIHQRSSDECGTAGGRYGPLKDQGSVNLEKCLRMSRLSDDLKGLNILRLCAAIGTPSLGKTGLDRPAYAR
jgi:hypothetical protein